MVKVLKLQRLEASADTTFIGVAGSAGSCTSCSCCVPGTCSEN